VERRFSINKHVFNKTRVKLKQHTISEVCTVKYVINKFRGAHAAYTEYLSVLQKEATATEEEK